jgi:hypothetical protein
MNRRSSNVKSYLKTHLGIHQQRHKVALPSEIAQLKFSCDGSLFNQMKKEVLHKYELKNYRWKR